MHGQGKLLYSQGKVRDLFFFSVGGNPERYLELPYGTPTS